MSEITLHEGVVYGLKRCPQCAVAKPFISRVGECHKHYTDAFDQTQYWFSAKCSHCGAFILMRGSNSSRKDAEYLTIEKTYPTIEVVDEALPDKAKNYLQQAVESLHAPDGAVMLSASAVDAMLKEKGYSDSSLYSRINKATEEHLLTEQMRE